MSLKSLRMLKRSAGHIWRKCSPCINIGQILVGRKLWSELVCSWALSCCLSWQYLDLLRQLNICCAGKENSVVGVVGTEVLKFSECKAYCEAKFCLYLFISHFVQVLSEWEWVDERVFLVFRHNKTSELCQNYMEHSGKF